MLENTTASSTARDGFFAEAEKLHAFADGLESSMQQICDEISTVKITIPERNPPAENHELETALFNFLRSL